MQEQQNEEKNKQEGGDIRVKKEKQVENEEKSKEEVKALSLQSSAKAKI